jgi:hypothetical protein
MCFDVIIGSPSSADKSRYWGSSSVFALAVELVQHSVVTGLISTKDASLDLGENTDVPSNGDTKDNDTFQRLMTCAAPADVQGLVSLYISSFNAFYPFADERLVPLDLQAYLDIRSRPSLTIRLLKGNEAHQFFRISLMCAISCANEARHRPSRAAESLVYYMEALDCIGEVASEASPASLRAILLLVLYSLFEPSKGDIWKLLDYACRLMIELGWHTEASPYVTEPGEHEIYRRAFWGLYDLERIVSQLFGRGPGLPETAITTEFPTSDLVVDSMDLFHHYRLVCLRSELYRTMYIPTKPPGCAVDLLWLREKYGVLRAWRQESTPSEPLSSLRAVACTQGYNQTMCLLFQPLLLQALHRTRQKMDDDERIVVVADSYWAAVDLINTYDQLLRASKSSSLGAYPMTFLSAHYIWLATSTLMAHAALAIAGRIITLRKFSDWVEGDGEEAGETINYATTFPVVSATCSKLLHWCVERWPSMLGLLDVYDRLILRLTREWILRG